MNCFSEKPIFRRLRGRKAFSLVETVMALIILGLVVLGVLETIDRCMIAAGDSALRMRAFEVARENMEMLLSAETVEPMTDFGYSDKYPEIAWETAVDTFFVEVTKKTWIRGACSAEYLDSTDQTQKIELTSWLTELTAEQMQELMRQKEDANLPDEPNEPNKPVEPNETEPNKPR